MTALEISTAMTATEICSAVAAAHGISIDMLQRNAPLANRYAEARHEAMWLIRKEIGWSYPRIGRYFGGFDHSTVMTGIRRHQKLSGVPDGSTRNFPNILLLCQKIEMLQRRIEQLEASLLSRAA